tara:strand:+ start:940 stop:1254 length:315 start_codon:yes stop_codon:yes gene_type:complete
MKKRDTKEVILVAVTVIAALIVGSGCSHTREPNEQYRNIAYKYYVIDSNSDVPDAFFETYDEAAVYKKDFAEHHEYVIVKKDEKYNVYNMEPIENDTQTVQKSQ